MAESLPGSYQEVLDHLAKRAEENGDNFKLKVLRRPNATSQVTQHVAAFSDATWSMIANAESWLGPFSGGGLYVLHVFDGRDPRKQYGVITPSEITGSPRPPDSRATKTSAWLGPTLIDAGPIGGPQHRGDPAFPPVHTLAGEPLAGGVPPRSVAEAGLSGLFDEGRRLNDEIRRKEAELADRERKISEERAKNEIEALRRTNEEARRANEDRMRRLEERLATPPPGPSITEILSGVLAGIGPFITAWISSSTADRAERAALERARLEREEKRAEAQAIAFKEAASKPLIDPTLLEIIKGNMDQARGQAAEFAALMKAQAEGAKANMEGQAIAQRSMLQTIADVAQIQAKIPGREDSPGIDWGKVVAGGLQAFAAIQARQGAPGAAGGPGMLPGNPQLAGANPGANGAAANGAAPPIPLIPSEELDKVEKMVRQKLPPDEVCTALKAALADEASKKEIEAMGGTLQVFERRLNDFAGDEKNGPYLEALLKELQGAKLVPIFN